MTDAHRESFACFGGTCAIEVEGAGRRGRDDEAARWGKAHLLDWHRSFSRFEPDSELSRLNRDPREVVPASALLLELAAAVSAAGALTGGLVDATLVDQIRAAGYDRDRGESDASAPLAVFGSEAAPYEASGPSTERRWASIEVDRAARTIRRPPGVQIDSGGLVKGLLADVLVGWLGNHEDVLVDACGDLCIGGVDPAPREVEVEHPFNGSVAHRLELTRGGVATSGTTRRRWTGPDGVVGHHLLDPATGHPANTGLVQVTALAPSALEAEVLAKWALLSGPDKAASRLTHGGVIIDAAGDVHVVSAGEVRPVAWAVPSTP